MKLFLVYTITINGSEPEHYGSYKTENLVGIYSDYNKALAKVDELHVAERTAEEDPEFWYFTRTAKIVEETLIN